MYLKEILINNYGCITQFFHEPKFTDQGAPKPIIFIGKNGTGKTLALSNIVESLVNLKKEKNTELQNLGQLENKKGKKDYIQSGKNYSYVNLVYEEDEKVSNYIELAVLDRNEFLASIDDITSFKEFDKFDTQFVKYGYFKKIIDEAGNDTFEKNIFLYFPVHRYYQPSWYSKDNAKIEFSIYDEELEELDPSIVKVNVLKEIEAWILDLILDRYLYESKFKSRTVTESGKDGKYVKKEIVEHLGFQGKNNTTINLLNNLLTIIYKKKYKDFEYARLGISKKEKRKVSIIVKQKDQPEIQLAPTFSHLSSGEAMLISLFGAILKQYDLLNENGAKSLDEIKGIVLIDEVDLNLNLEYAKEIVPELISAFKGVQFIVTTHSPFFLLGMKEHFKDGVELVHMPNGAVFEDEESFRLISKSYKTYVENIHKLES